MNYDPNKNYVFTDKDGNTFTSKGDNGYVWQSITEGVPLSVDENGEWHVGPYLNVTPTGIVAHIPQWFKGTSEYEDWNNTYVPQLKAEGNTITADRFKQYEKVLSSLGSMGGFRYTLQNDIKQYDGGNIISPEEVQRYVDSFVRTVAEGQGGDDANLTIWGQHYESAADFARHYKELSKESLSKAMTSMYDIMQKGKDGKWDDDPQYLTDAVLAAKVLNYIDDNSQQYGRNNEFDGLLSSSAWQQFNRGMTQFMSGITSNSWVGYPARVAYAAMQYGAKGEEWDFKVEDLYSKRLSTGADLGANLEGNDAADVVGTWGGTIGTIAVTMATMQSFKGFVNGKMAGASAGTLFAKMGTIADTIAFDFFVNDLPVDLLMFTTDSIKYGAEKAWYDPENPQPLFGIPFVRRAADDNYYLSGFGPDVPGGLLMNMVGDLIIDLTPKTVGIVLNYLDNNFNMRTNATIARAREKIAVANLELQSKIAKIPVFGEGWSKFINAMMGPRQKTIVAEGRKAAIAQADMDFYIRAQNILTLNNHNGMTEVFPRYQKLDAELNISKRIEKFQANANKYGGFGVTREDWSAINAKAGKVESLFKEVPDQLPVQVKQGLLDVERLSELKGEVANDGGIFLNPARQQEIAALEERVSKLPQEIKDFADDFSTLNKRVEQMRVELGISTQEWIDALQLDPRWEKYMTRQALTIDGQYVMSGATPPDAKILNASRKGYYDASKYIDPTIALGLKLEALGKAYAWNETQKFVVAAELAQGNKVIAGKGGVEVAERLGQIRAEIAEKTALRKEVGYDDTVGSYSTDMSAVRNAFTKINDQLNLPEKLSLKAVYDAAKNPTIKEMVNDFSNGKITFADGVKQKAGLSDNDAADVIQNTYAYKGMEYRKTDRLSGVNLDKKVFKEDSFSSMIDLDNLQRTGDTYKQYQNRAWSEEGANFLFDMKNEAGETDFGLYGVSEWGREKIVDDIDQKINAAEKAFKESGQWQEYASWVSTLGDKKLALREAERNLANNNKSKTALEDYETKLADYEDWYSKRPIEDVTEIDSVARLFAIREQLYMGYPMINTESFVDSKPVISFYGDGKYKEGGFQNLTRGEIRRALYEEGYDNITNKDFKKAIDKADNSFTQRTTQPMVVYRGETADTTRTLKVGDKVDSASWTYTAFTPKYTDLYREGITNKKPSGRKTAYDNKGVIFRYHLKEGSPVYVPHKDMMGDWYNQGVNKFKIPTATQEFVLPRDIDGTIIGITKDAKLFSDGSEGDYVTVVDVEVNPNSGVTPKLRQGALTGSAEGGSTEFNVPDTGVTPKLKSKAPSNITAEAKALGDAEIKTTAKETIPTLSYKERLSLAKDIVDDSNGKYILLYRMQNGTPDKWRANNRGVEGKFEASGGEPALKGAVWLTADRKWVEGPDRATAGVQSAWTSGEKVTDDNIVVIPVKKSDILDLNQEQNAKVELENSGKKIVKTRGIEGGLGKSEYILWENEHPEIFEEGMKLLAEKHLEKNLSSPELADRMVGPSAKMNVQGEGGATEINVPDTVKDMPEGATIDYNAGMTADGRAFRYEIEDGKITSMEEITDSEGMAAALSHIGGSFTVPQKFVEALGQPISQAIGRTIMFYRDTFPDIGLSSTFYTTRDDGNWGFVPWPNQTLSNPYGLKIVDGKVDIDTVPVYICQPAYAKGQEARILNDKREEVASGRKPKNTATLESTPTHENGHSLINRLGILELNRKIDEGKVPKLTSFEEMKGRVAQEIENLQDTIIKNALDSLGMEVTESNITRMAATISDYASKPIRRMTEENPRKREGHGEIFSEAVRMYQGNGQNSSPFCLAVVEQMKRFSEDHSMAAAPGDVLARNGLEAPRGVIKDGQYNFPSTVKTNKQKAKWLDQWRQKNPYLGGKKMFTEEGYQKANLWDTFFQKEIRAFDAKSKSTMPDSLVTKNGDFLKDLSANAAKNMVSEIKKASVKGFDEDLASIVLSHNSRDIFESIQSFIVKRVNQSAGEIAAKMPGGPTAENLNKARATVWSEGVIKNETISMLQSLSPDAGGKSVTNFVDKLFKEQSEGFASVDALPLETKQLIEQKEVLQQRLAKENRYAIKKGKEVDAGSDLKGEHTQVISYKQDGEDVYVVITDPVVATLLQKPDEMKTARLSTEMMAQAANFISRAYRVGTTGANPIAVVRNVLRDPLQATFSSGYNPLNMSLSPDIFYHTLRDYGLDNKTIQMVTEKLHTWASSSGMTQEMRNMGIKTPSNVGYRNKFEKAAKRFQNSEGVAAKVIEWGERPLETWETLFRNDIAQQSFIKNYRRSGDVNKALGRAYFDASNATTNFSHSIACFKRATGTVPYLSSAINGTRSFWVLFNADPVGMITRLSAGFMVPAMAITAWNLSSDERRKAYMNLPEWYRDGHIVLVDLEGRVFSLPIPEELEQFYGTARRLIEYTQEASPYSIPQIMAKGAFGFLPVETDGYFGEDGSVNWERGTAQMLSGMMPQAVTAVYEFFWEKDLFTGQDLSDYSAFQRWLNLGTNILGTGFKNLVNDVGSLLGAPKEFRLGKNTAETLARDLFGVGFDNVKYEFMEYIGNPTEYNYETGKTKEATGLFKENEKLQGELARINQDIAFAKDDDEKAKLEELKQKKIDDFTTRVTTLTNKYLTLYSQTGGLEEWQKEKLVKLLTLGRATTSADEGSYEKAESSQAYLNERALAQQRYLDAGLPGGPSLEALADNGSIELQAAVNRFYGVTKQATQDFKNAVEESGMKDVKDRFYGVMQKIYDSAEEQGKSPDYDLIERIQARYLQMMDSALIPIINQYGINVLNNNDFIDAVRKQVSGMIPSDDWRQSTKNAKRFLSTKEFPTATVDVKKWLKNRFSSGMKDRGLASDQEVTDRIDSIKADIDAGRTGAAKGKIEDLKRGVQKASYYISAKDLQTLNELYNMVK